MGRERILSGDAQGALEWGRLLDLLAQQAHSTVGAVRCRTLVLEDTMDASGVRMAETTEMVHMRAGTEPFPPLQGPDLREVFGRAMKGGSLDALELRDTAMLLRMTEDVVRYVARHRAEVPAIAAVAAPLPPLVVLTELRAEIEWVVDPDGTIKDTASPDLRRLTQQVHDLKQTMRRRLESILQSKRYADVLQEHYFAQREGRYVVPVKTDMRTTIPGIVHDVSASGATVFLEPRELVELNNGIKVGELAVDREVRRILQELTGRVASQAESLLEAQEVLTLLDVIQAKAALAGLLRARAVPLNDRGRIRLIQARHPLLALSRAEVVANDVELDDRVHVMVISGANTGGKTVTLKLVGLFALMVRAGLLLPCEPGSEMAWFPDIYADIGDAQDLARDLSSFSSHVTRMIHLLGVVSSHHPATGDEEGRFLVLLDEPMTSTDPAEGAALAQALLSRLAQLKVKAIITTHYTELKVLAQETPGFVNASVEFDVSRLAPTYRLITGIPGGSSAIEIAGRLGMDETLLDAARERLRKDEMSLEHLLSDLQSKHRRLSDDLARVEALRRESEEAKREVSLIAERLREAEQAERRAAKKKVSEEVQRARASVQAVIDELRKERTIEKAKAAKARLASIEDEATAVAPAPTGLSLQTMEAGDLVELVNLGTRGTLLEAPAGLSRIKVRVGTADLSVPAAGLIGVARRPSLQAARPETPAAAPSRWDRGPLEEPVTVVDVRGKGADDALEEVIAQLDRASLAGAPIMRIIHGHGTGKLKGTLRDYLKESPYVGTFRSGERAEGGDGVTVVELKR